MRHLSFLFVTVLLSTFVACCGAKKDNYDTLISSQWNLQSIVNQDGSDSVAVIDPVTIIFTDSSTVAGHGGCNAFFGVYSTMGDDEIDIEIKGRTMAMCPSLDVEDGVIATLELSTTYLAQGDELQINDLENGLTLIFKAIK